MTDRELQVITDMVARQLQQFTETMPTKSDPGKTGERLADLLLPAVQSYVARCLQPLAARIAKLERHAND
jgi:hypothetical protein